jgi:fatty-acyl-CoA synthase
VLDDSGAVALVSSQALADVVMRLDLSVIGTLICADGELPGFERYDDVLAAVPAGPLEDEREGREMLYSSGTTGRHHSAPLVWSMSLQRFGATIVVMEQFDPARCLELIERYRVSQAQFVPTMFTRSPSAGPSWCRTSARARSTSRAGCRASRTGSCTNAACVSATGRGTRRLIV